LEIALAIMRRRNMAADARCWRNSACERQRLSAKALGERRCLPAPYARRLSDGLVPGRH
jgi:hypothetical protein